MFNGEKLAEYGGGMFNKSKNAPETLHLVFVPGGTSRPRQLEVIDLTGAKSDGSLTTQQVEGSLRRTRQLHFSPFARSTALM